MSHKYLYLAIIIVFLGIGAKLYSLHTKAVEAAKASVVSEYDREYVRGLEDQLEVTKAVLEDSQIENGKLANAKDNIGVKYSALLDSVRKRPTREEAYSASDSTGACPAPAITGQELSREDAEFLAGEATAAMTVLEERNMYYRSYVNLKNQLDILNGKN